MNSPTHSPSPDALLARQRLLTLRVIWFALLAGEAAFAAIVLVIFIPNNPKPAAPNSTLTFLSFALCALMLPAAFAARRAFHRRAVAAATPAAARAAYFAGNIVFWAACDTVAFVGLIVAMINASLWPTAAATALAVALQILTFPRTAQPI